MLSLQFVKFAWSKDDEELTKLFIKQFYAKGAWFRLAVNGVLSGYKVWMPVIVHCAPCVVTLTPADWSKWKNGVALTLENLFHDCELLVGQSQSSISCDTKLLRVANTTFVADGTEHPPWIITNISLLKALMVTKHNPFSQLLCCAYSRPLLLSAIKEFQTYSQRTDCAVVSPFLDLFLDADLRRFFAPRRFLESHMFHQMAALINLRRLQLENDEEDANSVVLDTPGSQAQMDTVAQQSNEQVVQRALVLFGSAYIDALHKGLAFCSIEMPKELHNAFTSLPSRIGKVHEPLLSLGEAQYRLVFFGLNWSPMPIKYLDRSRCKVLIGNMMSIQDYVYDLVSTALSSVSGTVFVIPPLVNPDSFMALCGVATPLYNLPVSNYVYCTRRHAGNISKVVVLLPELIDLVVWCRIMAQHCSELFRRSQVRVLTCGSSASRTSLLDAFECMPIEALPQLDVVASTDHGNSMLHKFMTEAAETQKTATRLRNVSVLKDVPESLWREPLLTTPMGGIPALRNFREHKQSNLFTFERVMFRGALYRVQPCESETKCENDGAQAMFFDLSRKVGMRYQTEFKRVHKNELCGLVLDMMCTVPLLPVNKLVVVTNQVEDPILIVLAGLVANLYIITQQQF